MNFSELSMRERAQIIKEAVANGYTKRVDIEKDYNEFALGGHKFSFGSWIRQKLGLEEKPEETPKITYTRQQENDSPTKEASEKLEDKMNSNLRGHSGQYDHKWDIPYIPDKETKIVGNRVSTNALDSLAKYAEITGVPIEEAVGLALYETHLGGSPFVNYKDGATEANRALGNASFFRNYGYIPAWALIRDNEYITEGYDKTKEQKAEGMSPLEHGLLIYKSGKYNTGLGPGVHTARVKSKAAAVKKDANYQQWLEDRNQHSTGGPLYPFSFSKKGIPEVRM